MHSHNTGIQKKFWNAQKMAWGDFGRVLCADSKFVVRLSLSPLVHEVFEFEILKNTRQSKLYIYVSFSNIHNQILTSTD